MRIPGNKIRHLQQFFQTELNGVYESSEIEAMFYTAVASILGLTKTDALLKIEENINQSDLLKLYDCAKDLRKQIPLQYILKEAWFYNLPFFVDRSVLIPRPETEELVDIILKENPSPVSLLDIGTGSGCIPITIKKKCPATEVIAVDISPNALAVAQKNAQKHSTPVNFIETEVLVLDKKLPENLEIIVSNPPYIKDSEKNKMSANVLDHEPHQALFVKGEDAIIFYRKIIELCKMHLQKKGKLYFELNPLTAEEVKNYADSTKLFKEVELIKDMSGAVRFLRAVKS